MIYFHKKFKKDFKKLSQKEKDKFEERLNLFLIDEFNPILNNHPLNGVYERYRSINVSGDIRAIYEIESTNIRFITIGNHNNLYK
ncbi:MAG: type II toxin-antitoxin system mRNA interferase toxin, RelE/StbE family [Candidatus Pacebacteria bacterium]|nr:type II toxin-antitoxin system mRNA interferase toxin, RelE/StbE family [Candidatus Paceibacterota bacterium]MDD3048331.1 type II toxin-antitoxin system mRNA interferase toxin, RelE/StbE family [Candidatus Paceibacterota bacterium]